jgi:tRNA dimethylallyltransferase
LKALTGGLFAGPGRDSELRAKLDREITETGLASLYQRLITVDPSANRNIHPNDRQRIIRALEVYQSTGRPLSAWQNEHRFHDRSFEVLKIGLERERSELYDLINERTESMIRAGLLDEVRGLMERGYSLDLKPLRSVGYRQMGEVIKEIKTLPEALEEMKQETRRLAKRQLTWFRSDPEIRWFHPEKQKWKIADLIDAFLGFS